MSDFGHCRSCGQPIRWARSAASGKPMPLQEDRERGNVALDGFGRAHVFADHAKAIEAIEHLHTFPYGVTFLPHHAVCRQRGEWSHAPHMQTVASEQGTLL